MKLKLRLEFENGLVFGPGKAEMLERIAETGSISAAGRAMGMSYRRAWGLVEEMNAGFAQVLVAPVRGGAKGGGAVVTEAGLRVLAQFRALEGRIVREGAAEIDVLSDMLARK